MKIGSIECNISCENELLTEYQEKTDSADLGNKTTHIISEAGKRFIVRVRNNSPQFGVVYHLWIDGKRMECMCVQDNEPHDMLGTAVGESQRRPYLFSNITTTDDDRTLKQSLSTAKDFGVISIDVFRINGAVPGSRSLGNTTHEAYFQNQPLHERTKKAGTHRVTLGDLETRPIVNSMVPTYIDPLSSPFYTFTWRYRPKAILQAQGVVPQDPPSRSNKRARSSGPSGSSSKRPRLDKADTDDESNLQDDPEDIELTLALQARRDALRAERTALEAREAALENELRQARGIKRETSPITLVADDEVVIDLTGDD